MESKELHQFNQGVIWGKMYSQTPWLMAGYMWGLYIGSIEKMFKDK